MLGSIGGILSGVGAIAGAFGKGESGAPAQQKQGFAALPQEIQDYLLGDYFTRVQSYGETPYESLPKRRVNESDLDPIFGSKARRDMQNTKDVATIQEFLQNYGTPTEVETGDKAADDIAALEERMLARQYLMSGGHAGDSSGRERVRQQYAAGLYGDEALGQIGKALGKMSDLGHGVITAQNAGVAFQKLMQEDMDAYEGFGAGMNSALLEAAKQKGLV